MVPSPSPSTRLLAFVLTNVLHFVIISAAIVLVFGSAFYPASIGLYLSLPYLTYTILFARHELRRGAPWPWFSETFPLFSIMRSYLQLDFAPIPEELLQSVEIKKKDEKKKNSQYVFALFPHGTASDYRILMDGRIAGILPQIGGNYRVLTASILFRLPLLRELALWTRCVDARRSVAHGILNNDDELSSPLSIMVVPGGEAEQIRTEHGKETVYLSRRKGFIRIALLHNVPVVPVYVFGCSDAFQTSNAMFVARKWLVSRFRVGIPLSWGVLGSFCPFPVKHTVAFGKPLHFVVQQEKDPTDAETNRCHAQFCKALVDLFDEHKGRLGYSDRNLVIV